MAFISTLCLYVFCKEQQFKDADFLNKICTEYELVNHMAIGVFTVNPYHTVFIECR